MRLARHRRHRVRHPASSCPFRRGHVPSRRRLPVDGRRPARTRTSNVGAMQADRPRGSPRVLLLVRRLQPGRSARRASSRASGARGRCRSGSSGPGRRRAPERTQGAAPAAAAGTSSSAARAGCGQSALSTGPVTSPGQTGHVVGKGRHGAVGMPVEDEVRRGRLGLRRALSSQPGCRSAAAATKTPARPSRAGGRRVKGTCSTSLSPSSVDGRLELAQRAHLGGRQQQAGLVAAPARAASPGPVASRSGRAAARRG